MAQWLSYLDEDAPVEISIVIDNGGYTVKWTTGRDDEETGDYVRGERKVGSLGEAVELVHVICTE